ncbi:ABC-2 type transport system permease protein [Saccharothrix ecbatanensis]|uniref:ABC-2 type transport system permease protein n=1 Tax=Saccharothrix ecbatanensis TaxID=1105145 RepID=A0A7W9HJH4_9PSEU|nr:ABC transporter permease [Saccharothrix ecbatanensis]MBB5803078.1 ABC-2 type transport system permease protein [Saccharothrix ecbatanensis]
MSESGVIHDIGYQRYTGPRLGPSYAARSLYVHSVRSAYGLGRSPWAKVLPFGLIGLAGIASLIIVLINNQAPEPVLDYVGIASTFTFAATVFVAVVAPELVSVDLRTNLLQLYLSRPLSRSGYALTKVAALATATFLLLAAPMLIMFIGMAFGTDDGVAGVLEEFGGLLVGLVAAAVHAVLLAALGLPIASLSGRRVFATGMIIGVFLLTAPISAVLSELGSGTVGRLAGLLDPTSLLNGVDQWLFGADVSFVSIGSYGPVYGLVTVALAALGTTAAVWRYKGMKS